MVMTDLITRESEATSEPEKKSEPGHTGQTFLVGEDIYLRGLAPGDEKSASRWRNSNFPIAPELVEKWIKEDLPKEGKSDFSYLAIVRKSDDTIVGSIKLYHGTVGKNLTPYVDPLYGEQGQRWLAEAVAMVADWQLGENYMPRVTVDLTTDKTIALAELLANGFVETARWREMHQVNGQRFDKLHLGRFNQDWIERVGDPMQAELPKTGSGDVRPVKPAVTPEGDPPKKAVIVGKRVYLRPQDKTDAKQAVEAARLETETFFDIGRHLSSEARWANFLGKEAGEDFPGDIWFEVCLIEDDKPIGGVGLIGVDYVNRTAETGSGFHTQEYRGQGYGSEAKQLLLEYTFDHLGFHMVNSFVYFANTRSAAALRKQGYKEAGRVCWLYPFEGGLGNMVTFDLLADEWRALPREQ